MELPVRFVYTENGVEKTSVDENKRMNYIDQINQEILKDSIEEIGKKIAKYNSGRIKNSNRATYWGFRKWNSKSQYEHGGYVETVVLMTRWKNEFEMNI